MLNFPHDIVRLEWNCGDAKSFIWLNLSSFRDDNVRNGIVTHVVSNEVIRFSFRSIKDKWLMMINNIKMRLDDIGIALIDLNRSDSMKWMNGMHINTSTTIDVSLSECFFSQSSSRKIQKKMTKRDWEQLSIPLDNAHQKRHDRKKKRKFFESNWWCW